MTNLNANTKKAAGLIWQYENAAPRSELNEVYKNASCAKYRAMRYCKDLQKRLNGYAAKIPGHSCMFFSYAFKFIDDGIEKLVYITHANDYVIEIEK